MAFFKKSMDGKKDQVVRRVIKQGSQYLCGLCARRYPDQAEAETCLSNCSRRFFSQEVTTTAAPEAKAKRYRCSFCKRVYDSAPSAKDCAKACRQNIQKKMTAETSIRTGDTSADKLKLMAQYAEESGEVKGGGWTTPDVLPDLQSMATQRAALGPGSSSPRPAPRAGGKTYTCEECHEVYSSPYEAQDCYASHQKASAPPPLAKTRPLAPADSVAPATKQPAPPMPNIAALESDDAIDIAPEEAPLAPSTSTPSAPPGKSQLEINRQQRADDKELEKKFFRDGAKYVCRICSKKYFTKSDVLACFDAHEPEAEEYVTGGPSKNSPAPADPPPPRQRAAPPLQDDKERFFRDGAKYVCKKCGAKYFTRTEVVSCFDGHS